MKITQLIAILFFSHLHQGQVFSQNLFELEAVYSPAFAKLSSNSAENKLLNSAGLKARIIFKSNFYIDGGLYFRRLGNRFELPRSILSTGPYKVTYLTSSIDIPINIGYYFLSQKKIRMGIAFGLDNGFLLDQKSKSLGEKNDIGIYRFHFLGVTSNLELGFKIKSNFTINFRPNWLQQINKNNGPYKQRAIGVEVGVAYKMN